MRRFTQVDVFSSVALAGNPLAVVTEGDGLTHDEMQAFARWTNLSETTFLVSPSDPRAHYRVRIFTPGGEIDFAGHPTLGSCHAWLDGTDRADEDRIIQECGAGLIEVRPIQDGFAFAAPPLTRSGELGDELTRHIASLLRITPDDIIGGSWVDNGAGWAGVLLRDAGWVLGLSPGSVDLDIGVIGPHPIGGPADFEVRAFFPKNGATAEDPVTGSLNAGLAQWLISAGRASTPYTVRQGTAIGHAGTVSVFTEEGVLWIGGATRTVVTGMVML
jgi:PhzF family phenazine biosynthesis protein